MPCTAQLTPSTIRRVLVTVMGHVLLQLRRLLLLPDLGESHLGAMAQKRFKVIIVPPSRVACKWSESGRSWLNSIPIWSTPTKFSRTSIIEFCHLGRIGSRCGRVRTTFGRLRANIGRSWSNAVQTWTISAHKFDRFRAKCGRTLSMSTRPIPSECWPTLVEVALSNCSKSLSSVCRFRARIDQCRSRTCPKQGGTMRRVRPTSAGFGQVRPKLARTWPTSGFLDRGWPDLEGSGPAHAHVHT